MRSALTAPGRSAYCPGVTSTDVWTVDSDLPTPAYAQIVDQTVEAIGTGRLVPGEKLPPVRALATQLGVAVNTVAKAYRQLEEEGHVETRGRGGTLVREGHGPDSASRLAAEALALAAHEDGLELDEAVGLLRRSWSPRPRGARA